MDSLGVQACSFGVEVRLLGFEVFDLSPEEFVALLRDAFVELDELVIVAVQVVGDVGLCFLEDLLHVLDLERDACGE